MLSGVDVVYTRICRCAVWCKCCLNENLEVLSGVDVVYTRICRFAVWCGCCLNGNL